MNKIKDIVKSSKIIYKLYYIFGSLLLRLLGIFVKVDDDKILFVVYGGLRYDDSPKFIYEYMASDAQYDNYKYVWAFVDPKKEAAKNNFSTNTKLVKIDTFGYYIEALKAKYWITNSSVSRGLNFKKRETINIYTQHGMAGIKVLGNDIKKDNKSFRNGFSEQFDRIIIEGKRETSILKKAWNVNEDVFLNIGLPRNDELINPPKDKINRLKTDLGIPADKKVILYAPTFREYNRNSNLSTYIKPPFDFDYWAKELGDKYILLFTAHYEIAKLLNMPKHPFVNNKFKYPNINDLILVSDILISDYSSIIFDYSILEKPIIAYAYDYDIYSKERGVYDGYEKIFSHGFFKDEKDIIAFIKKMDYEKECKYTRVYIKNKYVNCPGNSTKVFVETFFRDAK